MNDAKHASGGRDDDASDAHANANSAREPNKKPRGGRNDNSGANSPRVAASMPGDGQTVRS